MSAPRQRPALFWPVVLLGLLGNLLFRADHLGLNVGWWVLTAIGLWVAQRRHAGTALTEVERGLLLVLLALAGSYAWRANALLLSLNAVGIIVAIALLPLAAAPDSARMLADLTVGRLVGAVLRLGGRTASGALPILLEAQVRPVKVSGASRWLTPVARGSILAAPALLLFGALLGSADPVFGDFLAGLVRFDARRFAGHLLGTVTAAWVGAAVLRGLLPESSRWALAATPPRSRGLGPIEVGVTLGLVNLLFGAFIAFQLPYLFGGAGWVERTAGVTLAEYARRGFFELVTLAALVLPLLLVIAGRLDPASHAAGRVYRSLAGIQVLLVLSIMGSAAHRMSLYLAQFGLTQDRFFASAFMAGLAVTALWFLVTTLRDRPAFFARGALLSWGAWLMLLNASNPERVIVESNLARLAAGQSFDASYLARLGPDAVPALAEALPRMPPEAREQLRSELVRRFTPDGGSDWRDWHYARHVAREVVLTLGSPPLTLTDSP